jgi:hypothetical protein
MGDGRCACVIFWRGGLHESLKHWVAAFLWKGNWQSYPVLFSHHTHSVLYSRVLGSVAVIIELHGASRPLFFRRAVQRNEMVKHAVHTIIQAFCYTPVTFSTATYCTRLFAGRCMWSVTTFRFLRRRRSQRSDPTSRLSPARGPAALLRAFALKAGPNGMLGVGVPASFLVLCLTRLRRPSAPSEDCWPIAEPGWRPIAFVVRYCTVQERTSPV